MNTSSAFKDRYSNTAHAIREFAIINGIALRADVLQFLSERIRVCNGVAGHFWQTRSYDLFDVSHILKGQQGFADGCAVQQRSITYLKVNDNKLCAFDPQYEHGLMPIQDRQMQGLVYPFNRLLMFQKSVLRFDR